MSTCKGNSTDKKGEGVCIVGLLEAFFSRNMVLSARAKISVDEMAMSNDEKTVNTFYVG